MLRHSSIATLAGFGALMVMMSCFPDTAAMPGTEDFPRGAHSLLPEGPAAPEHAEGSAPGDTNTPAWQIGSGMVTGEGPAQPIGFPHFRHVTELGMQCEYCHSNARKAIHGGVPDSKVCAGCHWQVKKDLGEIKKITSFGEGCDYTGIGTLNDKCQPIPWKKVHDLPDFVHFNHSRHVQGGVQCTECHGQIGLQGKPTTWFEVGENGERVEKTGVPADKVMIRETTMQMGWCLDCHGTHPSIDKNYGDKADLRRAELKDCWTCHK